MKFLQLSLLLAIVLVARALPVDEKSVDEQKRVFVDETTKRLDDVKEVANKKDIEAEKLKEAEKKESIERDIEAEKKEFEAAKKEVDHEMVAVAPQDKPKEVVLKRTIEEIVKKTIEEPVIRADFDKKEVEAMEAAKKNFEEAIDKKDDETAKRLFNELTTKKRSDAEPSKFSRFSELPAEKKDFIKKEFEAKREQLKREFDEAIEKKDYETAKRLYNKAYERKRAFGIIKRTSGLTKRGDVVTPAKRITIEKTIKKTIEEVPVADAKKPVMMKKTVTPVSEEEKIVNRRENAARFRF